MYVWHVCHHFRIFANWKKKRSKEWASIQWMLSSVMYFLVCLEEEMWEYICVLWSFIFLWWFLFIDWFLLHEKRDKDIYGRKFVLWLGLNKTENRLLANRNARTSWSDSDIRRNILPIISCKYHAWTMFFFYLQT